MKKFAKITDGMLTTTCAAEEDTELIAQITADGFKSYNDAAGKPDVGVYQEACPFYREDVGSISLEWKIIDNSPDKIAAEITLLQSELAATDYQVIKSYEYALAGQPSPYDIAAIHASRQTIRDRITEMEALLTES